MASLEPPALDLRGPASRAETPRLSRELPQYSLAWARVVRPVAWFLMGLTATLMLLPFLLIWALDDAQTPGVEVAVQWAHTVLPPAVGFVGGVVGYYFGTRGGESPPPEDQ